MLSSHITSQERRLILDRRKQPTSFISILRLHGRRKAFRRQGEARAQYVDCPSKRTIILTLLMLTFSILDAWFTVTHLNNGAFELNPIVRLILPMGTGAFLGIKSFGIGAIMAFLAMHQNFKVVWYAMHCLSAIYGIAIGYHLILLLN